MEWLLEEGPRGAHGSDPPIRLESNVTLPGAGAGHFYVLLRGEAAHKAAKAVQHLAPKEDQDTLCVVRLYKPLKKHFTGQKVLATGKIDRIKLDRTVIYADGESEGPRTISTDYVMTIDKPENVRFSQQVQANAGFPPMETITPEQVQKQQPEGKVAVRFRIEWVGLDGWTQEDIEQEEKGLSDHGGDPPLRLEAGTALTNGGKFYILLRGKAHDKAAEMVRPFAGKENQDTRCVVRLFRPHQKYFTGKVIEASGPIERVKRPRAGAAPVGEGEIEEYRIMVDTPDNFRVLP